jgi:DNA-binding MarR family transcriptional regulator
VSSEHARSRPRAQHPAQHPAPAEAEVGAAELGELLVGAWQAFTRKGLAGFQAHGLSPARVRLLLALASAGGTRMSSLAEQLGVTNRAITGLVDALEREGVVARRADPADRRAIRLELTDAGVALVAKIERLQHQVSEQIFAPLSQPQRNQLAGLLRRFIRAQRTDPDPAAPAKQQAEQVEQADY